MFQIETVKLLAAVEVVDGGSGLGRHGAPRESQRVRAESQAAPKGTAFFSPSTTTKQIAISRSLRSGAGQSSHGRENVKSNVASDALRVRLTSIEAFPRDRNAVFERPSARRLA